MVLPEMVRVLSDEERFIFDTTEYTRTATTWGVIKDYGNVVLSKAGLVAIRLGGRTIAGGGVGFFRVSIGGIVAFGVRATTASTYFTFICYLNAGTYNVTVENINTSGSYAMYVYDFECGFANFSDLLGSALAAYSTGISKTTTVRATPVGDLKNTVYCVTVYGFTSAAVTNMENPGESLTNGVNVLIDGVQKAWTERSQADYTNGASGGKLYVSASAGASHTVTIAKDNAGTVVNINVAVCPWILPSAAFEPVELSFPDGSTVYVVSEPLNVDVSKSVKIGKFRAVSFGDATDYYYSSVGVGILLSSYTFESVKVAGNIMVVSGFGGCISAVAVDLR